MKELGDILRVFGRELNFNFQNSLEMKDNERIQKFTINGMAGTGFKQWITIGQPRKPLRSKARSFWQLTSQTKGPGKSAGAQLAGPVRT